jgi:hypothetical protein
VNRLRARIIAVQAIVVSLLLVIVFLTILRPEDDSTLFGVDAPQSEPPVSGGGGDGGDGGQPGPGGDDTTEGPTGAGDTGGPSTTGDVAGGGVPEGPADAGLTPPVIAPGTPTQEGADGDDGGSPTDDQYSDTVARLMAAMYEEH